MIKPILSNDLIIKILSIDIDNYFKEHKNKYKSVLKQIEKFNGVYFYIYSSPDLLRINTTNLC